MTPKQKVEHVWEIVKEARQAQFTREQFVAITNRIWDAVEGGEQDAAAVQRTLTLESRNADSIS